VSDDGEADPETDVGIIRHGLRTTDDHVGHRVVGPDGTGVVDGLARVGVGQGGVGGVGSVRVPPVGVPALQAEFAGDHLLGEVPLADEQRDDVHLLACDGPEHLPGRGLFLPERLPHLLEGARRPDSVGVGEGWFVGRGIPVRAVSDDDQGWHW
jgi:hypothetical protein